MSKSGDQLLRRLEKQATIIGDHGVFEPCKYPGEPRWKLETKWITFECGCVAERCLTLNDPRPYEPIIFVGLPEQAVYEKVCDLHLDRMNYRIGTGHAFTTFDNWRRIRRNTLMGK